MASTAGAATLNVVGGQLLGATDVIVDGNAYNVDFLDGTCIALYGGCDDVSDFTFQSSGAAGLAAQALLDQVFLDGVEGFFDMNPALTNGCTGGCNVLVPFATAGADVTAYFAKNEPVPGAADALYGPFNISTGTNLTNNGGRVYAVWSPVPEPGTAILTGLGLLTLSVRKRRQR